jgi:GNAT superfamily N-acetyltransferase
MNGMRPMPVCIARPRTDALDGKQAPDAPLKIARFGGSELTPHLLRQLDAIFFETAPLAPATGPERDAFRERWLGRYLAGGSDVVLLAFAEDGALAGYLVGALDDPARQERFADISYFRTHFADLCRRFPSHLHINLASAFRNRGIGKTLIEAFAEVAARAGSPGMHVVTGRGMRNVRFYEHCGFRELASADRSGGTSVFLGRELLRPTS